MPSKADSAVARTIGIDTGKNTLHMVGLNEKGAIVLPEKVSRTRIAARFVNGPPCLIGIEAGMASHHVARELVALGHEVKQVPPAYSRPFRQGHKYDFRDAHAVAEAVERPSTQCVPIKTDEQLDLQALHRVRSRQGAKHSLQRAEYRCARSSSPDRHIRLAPHDRAEEGPSAAGLEHLPS
jgi:transposase